MRTDCCFCIQVAFDGIVYHMIVELETYTEKKVDGGPNKKTLKPGRRRERNPRE